MCVCDSVCVCVCPEPKRNYGGHGDRGFQKLRVLVRRLWRHTMARGQGSAMCEACVSRAETQLRWPWGQRLSKTAGTRTAAMETNHGERVRDMATKLCVCQCL